MLTCEHNQRNNPYLSVVMIILNYEETPAASDIMYSPLDLYDMGIMINCLISPLLESEWFCQVKAKYAKKAENYVIRALMSWVTWKHKTLSPTFMLAHSVLSKGTERSLTERFISTHSSSSGPNPTNLTRTSFNKGQNRIKGKTFTPFSRDCQNNKTRHQSWQYYARKHKMVRTYSFTCAKKSVVKKLLNIIPAEYQ